MLKETIIGSLFGQRLSRALDTIVKTYTAQKKFSGAVLVARGGRVLLSKGYGLANIEHDIPNTPQTVFRLGSMTKAFTAMLIMQLVEQGKLAIEDTLSRYLSDYPNAERITLYHLLSNTSGILDYVLMPGYRDIMRAPITLNALIAQFREEALEFEPGTDFGYSNSNWVLLGSIIEQVTGQRYAEALRQRIFDPAGMAHSGYDWTAPIIRQRASGYTDTARQWVNAETIDSSTMHAAGALYSTVEDLYHLDRALHADTLLRRATFSRMTQAAYVRDGHGYGLGWELYALHGHRVVAHSGGLDGFLSNLVRFVDDDATLIILSNLGGAATAALTETLAAALFGVPYELPAARAFVKVDPAVLADYVGDYDLNFGGRTFALRFFVEGDTLMMDVRGWSTSVTYPMSETLFYARSKGDVEMTFCRDVSGRVNTIAMLWGGHHITAQRVSSP
ncbi:MAG: serine hydrolase domain-containing protein [Anaerolineae bacterium]